MLKSYFAMAVRQLLAQKLYTAINVAGLALGLACALLIALFVRHELSYERHFADSERIVRISEDVALDPPLHFAGPRRRSGRCSRISSPKSRRPRGS